MAVEQPEHANQALLAVRELARLSALRLPRYVTYAPWTRISLQGGFIFEVDGDVTVLEPTIFRSVMETLDPLLREPFDTSRVSGASPETPADSVRMLLLKILFSKRAIVDCNPETRPAGMSQWWNDVSQLNSQSHDADVQHTRPRLVKFLDVTGRKELVERSVPSTLKGKIEHINLTEQWFDTRNISESDLFVILLPLHLDDQALSLNRELIELGKPFLRCGVGSAAFECGPLVIPGSSACLECVWRRRVGNQPILERLVESSQIPGSQGSPVDFALFGFLWLEVLRIVTTAQMPQTIGHIISGDVIHSSVSRRRVLRLPKCTACG